VNVTEFVEAMVLPPNASVYAVATVPVLVVSVSVAGFPLILIPAVVHAAELRFPEMVMRSTPRFVIVGEAMAA